MRTVSMATRRELVVAIRGRYASVRRSEKIKILDEFVARSCPWTWCRRRPAIVVSGVSGRDDQAAIVGSMMMASSLSGAIVSRVM
jgi:hypothetical protein